MISVLVSCFASVNISVGFIYADMFCSSDPLAGSVAWSEPGCYSFSMHDFGQVAHSTIMSTG